MKSGMECTNIWQESMAVLWEAGWLMQPESRASFLICCLLILMELRCASLQRPPACAPCASRLGLISLFSPYDRNMQRRDGFFVLHALGVSIFRTGHQPCDASLAVSVSVSSCDHLPSTHLSHQDIYTDWASLACFLGLLQLLFCIKQRRVRVPTSFSQVSIPGPLRTHSYS